MKQKTKKRFKRTMWIILSIVAILLIAVFVFTRQASFGKEPSGERLHRVKNSPHYKDGEFKNLIPTTMLTEGVGFSKIAYNFLFVAKPRLEPVDEIPSVKTDLHNLDRNKEVLVWFGHSSYFIQTGGKRILVDPVFSGTASPVSFITKAFKGSDTYKAEDMPDIDYLIITHNHWDHLNYPTVMQLKERIGKVICSLGVGENFEYWGFDKDKIVELDWNQDAALDTGFNVFCLPTRHFSRRGATAANQTLWASFLLQTPAMKIYAGGDGGYGPHFAEIGKRFGGIDLAMLENGQYGENWRNIHMAPEEVLQAAKDLQAKNIFPVHSAKFALSVHPWDEPLIRITKANEKENLRLLTPLIGEPVNLQDSTQTFTRWWEGLN